MKLSENNHLMRQSFSQSFMRIGQKLWIFYYWPILESMPGFFTQTLILINVQYGLLDLNECFNTKSEEKRTRHIQKMADNKESTIFVQSS